MTREKHRREAQERSTEDMTEDMTGAEPIVPNQVDVLRYYAERDLVTVSVSGVTTGVGDSPCDGHG